MKRLLLTTALLSTATPGWATPIPPEFPGWANSAPRMSSEPDATGPVLLNNSQLFEFTQSTGNVIDAPLTLYFIQPLLAEPTIDSIKLFDQTQETFSIGAMQTWTPGVSGQSKNFWAFEGCSVCNTTINLANIDAGLDKWLPGFATDTFFVWPVTINAGVFSFGDFWTVFGHFAVGSIVAEIGTTPEGGLIDTSWAGAGLVNTAAGAIPEPSTWAMMLLGFAGLGFAGYRRTARASSA